MTTYKSAGVDIAASHRAVELMRDAVQSTYTPAVLAGIGAFGGLFDATAVRAMDRPILVASTDGIGTKTKVAAALGRYDTIGQDLVNHCINDILVQGARPLFFLDYFAAHKLEPEVVAQVVGGVAAACRAAGCALIGGETAEMPGVYAPGELDLVGTIVGVVERDCIIDGSTIVPGDRAIGLASSGLHTNGYSLARRVLMPNDQVPNPNDQIWDLGFGIWDLTEALLAIHRSYLPAIERLEAAGIRIKGLAHITGGGLFDNVPRILPPGVAVRFETGTWPVPPIFTLIQEHGQVERDEMFHVFNMGIGMVVFVAAHEQAAALAALPGEAFAIGEVFAADDSGRRVFLV